MSAPPSVPFHHPSRVYSTRPSQEAFKAIFSFDAFAPRMNSVPEPLRQRYIHLMGRGESAMLAYDINPSAFKAEVLRSITAQLRELYAEFEEALKA